MVRTKGVARKGTLALAISLVSAGLPATSAWAQESSGDLAIEEVVVTGSRIARGNVNSPQPISTIDAEKILRSGQPDLAEILNDTPALMASITSTSSIDTEPNNSTEADNIGGSALDLRGLGYERTLTLVNGRRHVSGIEGTSAVDVGTIPSALIERVEVLTGGASAVYGADAVTGVVNFILRDDFEGFEVDVSPGIAGEGDAVSGRISALFGQNFDEGRGNLTFAVQYDYDDGLKKGDRDHFDDDGPWFDDVNPALRFQAGDIDAGSTPNFARYYNYDNTGLFHQGLRIPGSPEDFATVYEAQFGEAPSLTDAERALIERAATAPPRAILPGRTFNITSPYGVVALGDFGLETAPEQTPDLDGNGTPDCLDSFTGYNSSLVGASSFGAAGGCWFIDESGDLVPYQDGLVAGNFNHFGAEQSYVAPERPYVIPKTESYSVNFNGRYEFAPQLEAFWETKYVYEEVEFGGGSHNFTDLLYGAPDNPFLPEELRAFANNSGVGFVGPGGLYISRDSTDWGSNYSTNERTTYRFVAGLRGAFDQLGMDYEVSANYGRFERKLVDPEDMIADRFFAAIDVVEDPATGEPVCRSELDPTAYPRTTPFNIFPFVGGGNLSPFFTFTPGQGECQPANIWAGRGAISPEAIDFMTYTRNVEDEIEQTVFTGFVTGTSAPFFSLPAGPVDYVLGLEWRDENSVQEYGELDRGIIQVDGVTPDGQAFQAGDFVGDFSEAGALGEDPSVTLNSSEAGYDVWDIFAEVSVPVLAGQPFAEELSLNGAYRRADYSTFGTNETYGYGAVWSPVTDIRFRGSFSKATRVPNIFELFSPEQGAFFRPADPCDVSQLPTASDPALREQNCVAALQAIGVPEANLFDAQGNYVFADPLSAGFPGVVGGNEELDPETADTVTFGFVFQPRWVPGLSLTVDYWDIEIEDAIVEISEQRIVDSCYDATSLDNDFCRLIERNDTPTSAQSGGLTFLRQTQLNFGGAEAEGIDFNVNYGFELFGSNFTLDALVTHQDQLDLIEPTAPGEPERVDDELGETRRPEWSGQFSLDFMRGPLNLTWSTLYLGRQALHHEDGSTEIDTVFSNYGDAGFAGTTYIHDLNGSYQLTPNMLVYGGVQNLTDEDPYVTERGYPVSPRGRYFVAGFNWRL